MFLKKLFEKTGLKPITNLVAGDNGIVSLLRENNDPTSKISSKKAAASTMIFAAIAIATKGISTQMELITVVSFTVCGVFLLWVSAHYHKK